MVVYVAFLRDVACQKLLKSANVSRSYSQNNTGTVFFETRCIYSASNKWINVSRYTISFHNIFNIQHCECLSPI